MGQGLTELFPEGKLGDEAPDSASGLSPAALWGVVLLDQKEVQAKGWG